MTYLAKLFFYLLRDLIFENKDEYNHKSERFNTKRVILFILVALSFCLNGWLFYRFVSVSSQYIRYQSQIKTHCIPICEKKQQDGSLDSTEQPKSPRETP